tara:strand:- start:3835 stop:4197 length:363 start_codon:yes stop_codon:yes gene_type:complete
MSGNGNKGKDGQDGADGADGTGGGQTPIPGMASPTTFQPHLPGGMGLIAQQLAKGYSGMGGGGEGGPIMAFLQQMYKPVEFGPWNSIMKNSGMADVVAKSKKDMLKDSGSGGGDEEDHRR